MTEERMQQPSEQGPGIDSSILRGMTQRRISRRELGAGAGAIGLGAFLAACGVKGASSTGGATHTATAGGVGSASWWARQKLNKTVNFANWPYYIDVLKGKHPSLEHFTETTGIQVNYTEPINDNVPFYAKIRPSLQAKQYTGFDIIVMTNNSPPLGYLIDFGWLTPLDQSSMKNFYKYAGPLVKNPGTSVDVLFDKKYAGKVGMMNDPQELGSLGLLAIGVDPVGSTESEWAKAAKKLKQQKSDGIVRAYYDQSYIDHLKNGDTVVTQAWSGDIFQADLNSKYRDLSLLIPDEGGMFWTDNMCIPKYAQNPRDAMTLMDFYYQPDV